MQTRKNTIQPLRVISFSALALYVWLLIIFSTLAAGEGFSAVSAVVAVLIAPILAYLIFCLFSWLSQGTSGVFNTVPDHKHLSYCIIIFLITLSVYVIYWLCEYPGGMSKDSYDQYYQAVEGNYNNWHPVLHTLIFFTLPLKLTGSYSVVVFLQLLYFSAAFAYLAYVLIKNGISKTLLAFFCIFIWLNPYLATNLMYPWKDLAFLIFTMVLVGYYIQIVLSQGEWLNRKRNLVLFAVVTVLSGYMRHNAILFVIPLCLSVIFYAVKKRGIKFAIISFIAVGIVVVQLLYTVIGVESPDKRKLETVGLPATIWSSVMKHNPEALPEDMRNKLYEIATPYQYENSYVDGSFNHLKWTEGVHNEVIDEMSYMEVARITATCFIKAPNASLMGLAKLTSMVWGLNGEPIYRSNVSENEWSVESAPPFKFLENGFEEYLALFTYHPILKSLFGSIGLIMIILVSYGLFLFSKKRLSMIHMLPLFFYNFGTMLLLSGSDYRFFLINLPLLIPIVFLMLKDNRTMQVGKKKKQTE